MSTTAMQDVTSPATTGVGNFVWYELRTTDLKGAIDFYGHVVGWQSKSSGDPNGIPYYLFSVNGYDAAGVMELTPDMLSGGMKPAWMGFVGVDDVDAYATRLEQAGGKLHCPPQDIPTIGRWASVEDPQGAAFLLFKPSSREAPPRPAMGAPGTIGWHELSANDGSSAWTFYSELFGWKEDQVMDMGAMGLYHIFSNGGPQIGGMSTRDPATAPVPFWLFYFAVDDIDAAAARVAEKQGQIFMGPHEVPGGQWIVVGMDPYGAMFAVVGPRKK
jgi:predicted enzyme related to lactoylglutathione lyase